MFSYIGVVTPKKLLHTFYIPFTYLWYVNIALFWLKNPYHEYTRHKKTSYKSILAFKSTADRLKGVLQHIK